MLYSRFWKYSFYCNLNCKYKALLFTLHNGNEIDSVCKAVDEKVSTIPCASRPSLILAVPSAIRLLNFANQAECSAFSGL
ncbi:hypothetical protein T03_17050 [Trichinella britovi]|uniref:Uncharacterized protein n=1 Tax=Trichinella britovi TaxID=45882 RepID=A0A0V1C6F6_TRIBR|nr:hypothetical protein T03_8009 [Trichinella britovi]KRY44323.1 hypothetical protein T03_1129 [Trichinella britovi]KRY45113.1 hypothetical protein T03_17050 [Trichinella britovi]